MSMSSSPLCFLGGDVRAVFDLVLNLRCESLCVAALLRLVFGSNACNAGINSVLVLLAELRCVDVWFANRVLFHELAAERVFVFIHGGQVLVLYTFAVRFWHEPVGPGGDQSLRLLRHGLGALGGCFSELSKAVGGWEAPGDHGLVCQAEAHVSLV